MSPPHDGAGRVRRPPIGSLALLLGLPVLTRLSPARLARVLPAFGRLGKRGGSDRDPGAAATQVERALAFAARVRPQSCLTRGIARFVVLRRAGVPVELVFGFGSHEGVYAGHCWLELDGRPHLERTDPRALFPELLRIPEPA